jgi:predicted AAA+ superfamily ATPase
VERVALSDLLTWKANPHRKPLIVNGARQVGKTWLLKEFGRRHYDSVAYVNFESNKRMTQLFSDNLDVDRLLLGLRVEAGCPIEPERTLIIFDEIQDNPRALTALKYFEETAPGYHVVAAGSLLGVALHSGTAFPVGKTEFLGLHPLSFAEFVHAMGETALHEVLRTGPLPDIELFRPRLIELLRQYYCVGGMPEAVAAFSATKDLVAVRELQENLLYAYERDFSKYAPTGVVPRIRAVWNSIPAQLAREQRKFVYGVVKEGARAREYETAVDWLCDAGLLRKVRRVAKPGLPLKSYVEQGAFKLYLLDVGLLASHAGVPVSALIHGDEAFEEFKGALTEQYVSQELAIMPGVETCYWSTDGGKAEVDFVVQRGRDIVPIEVKASENLQAKSLKSYRDRFAPRRCYRISLSPWREETWLSNIPLYATSRLWG